MSNQRRVIRVVAAVVEQEGKYLITQRRPTAVLPLLWEFPGGKVEGEETDRQALVREMRERLLVEVEVGELLSSQPHAYDYYTVDLHVYSCKIVRGEPIPNAVHQFKWVTSGEFDQYPFTPPDEASVNKLLDVEDA